MSGVSKLRPTMGTRIIFITGTDTGVGKTVLTALSLQLLRSRGARALAIKPFCSGGRGDAELLHRLQARDVTLEQTNPFYFAEPVAPLVSARQHRREVPLQRVVDTIFDTATMISRLPLQKFGNAGGAGDFLLVEGSGGLLVPLGEDYTVRDLIARLKCEVIVVSRNRLGTINHSLLTVSALLRPDDGQFSRASREALIRQRRLKLVLMDQRSSDVSSQTNPGVLQQWLGSVPLARVPYLSGGIRSIQVIRNHAKKHQRILRRILDCQI